MSNIAGERDGIYWDGGHIRGRCSVCFDQKLDSLTELSMGERKRLGLYLPSGQTNYYRIQKMKGFGGSRREETWSKPDHMHVCCESRVPWRHKINCPRLKFEDEL